MKKILIASLGALFVCAGCGSDQAVPPAQQQQVRASFHQTPDVNTVKDPKMKAWIQGMIDSSKKGPIHDPSLPPKQ